MKKILYSLLTIFITFNLIVPKVFGLDVPQDTHPVDRCVKFVNLTEFAELKLIVQITGQSEPIQNIVIYEPNSCLPQGYGLNTINIYWTTEQYLSSIGVEGIKIESDKIINDSIFFITSDIKPNRANIDNEIPLISELIEYKIVGFVELNLQIHKHKQVLNYNDGTPSKEEIYQYIPTDNLSTEIPPLDLLFTDITDIHENFDAIKYVKKEQIVKGYEDGSFKPYRTITRAEFTKILIGSAFTDIKIKACITKNSFSDIGRNDWMFQYSCIARNNGIINGYSDNTFRPNSEISFIEASKIISNTYNYEITPDRVWYKPYMKELAKRNAIPLSITSFQKSITRGEMAEMIYRLKMGILAKPSNTYLNLYTYNWNEYKNDKLQISFKYPKYVTMNGDTNSYKLTIEYISDEQIKTTSWSKILFYEDKQNLEHGSFGRNIKNSFSDSRKVIKFGDNAFKDSLVLSSDEACNVFFERVLAFYHDNNLIIFNLSINKNDIITENPEYFVFDPNICSEEKIWDSADNTMKTFYDNIISNKAPEKTTNWYYTIQDIAETVIKF